MRLEWSSLLERGDDEVELGRSAEIPTDLWVAIQWSLRIVVLADQCRAEVQQ